MSDPDGLLGRVGAPVCFAVELTPEQHRLAAERRLSLQELVAGAKSGPQIPVQFEPTKPGGHAGRLWWLMPPRAAGLRTFVLEEHRIPWANSMRSMAAATGRWNIRGPEGPILSYHYQINEPGEVLDRVTADNRKYARARSDYIHPLYGFHGQELTKDWPLDHPHHRGIYWAWPEVDYHGERGDLHALQRVFARPTGKCVAQSGPLFAQIDAENQWLWEDREPIVRERAIIRAWELLRRDVRIIDLEFHFTALKDDVAIARRETKLYGGLNIRLAAVQDQRIEFHSDPPDAQPRMAWAGLYGIFPDGLQSSGLEVFQRQTNPDYPGDWVKYPELNWFQPTFPASGTRYVLKKDATLVLQFRLRVLSGGRAPVVSAEDECRAFQSTPPEPLSPAR